LEKNTEITGNFYVSKGTEYNFRVFSSLDLTVISDFSYNIKIDPVDTSAYTKYTVTGQVFLSDTTTEIESSSITINIFNENGGYNEFQNITYTKGIGYSLDTQTFGSSCVLFIEVNDHTNPAYSYYIKDIDLSASTVTLDFTEPSTGFSTVSVSGVVNSTFHGTMIYSDSIYIVQIINYSLPAITTRDVQIYNPENKSFFWTANVIQQNTPDTDDITTQIKISAAFIPESSVTLPVPSLIAPTEAVFGTSISYLEETLSFAGSADIFLITMISDEGDFSGSITSLTISVDLPDDIVAILTSSSDSYTSWDADIIPMNTSPGFDTDFYFNSQGYIPEVEYAAVIGAARTSTDLIP